MKIFLIIVLVLSFLLSIALIAKIKLKLFLSKQGYMVVQFLFFKYTVDFYGKKTKKQKEKQKPKKDKTKSKSGKDGYIKKLYKQKGVVDATTELMSIIKEIILKISSILSKSTIEELNFEMTVSEKDPALTAITYGAVSSLVYPAIGMINGILPVKRQNINLVANYENKDFDVNFNAYITVKFKNIISAGYLFLKEYIKTHIK